MERMSEEELRNVLQFERVNSVGMGDGEDAGTLKSQRERAHRYYRGEMFDMPVELANRSTATDSTMADTVDTLLPDLMEIFSSEDVVYFQPTDDDDVDAAAQETDYIRHVIFAENRGWLHLHNGLKDALIGKLGVFKWWFQEDVEETRLDDLPREAVTALAEEGAEFEVLTADEEGDRYSVAIRKKVEKACFTAWPQEDFGYAPDSSDIHTATYYVARREVRIQELIDEGFDEELVIRLDLDDDETADNARDTVDESSETSNAATNMLRRVTVHYHYIRMDYDGSGLKRWKVVTSADEGIVLAEPEIADGEGFSTITPFLNPHRVVGLSIADKTVEIQRIKTSLIRMLLDGGYFAMNQRVEISEADADDYTLDDYLKMEPGRPIRSKTGNAVRPITNGSIPFDVLGALEYSATMAEQRSGVIRNAQGLNPDALHDTASGQRSMLTMSQKRTRMIARTFAETGIRELFLGLHKVIREHSTMPRDFRRKKKFVQVDPRAWKVRQDMAVQIGQGGKEELLAALIQLREIMKEVIELQGGVSGPLIDMSGIYRYIERLADALPAIGVSDIFSDPEGWTPPEPQPDPEAEKAKAEIQLKQQTHQLDMQKAQAEVAQKREDLRFKEQESAAKIALMERESAERMRLEREKAEFEATLAERRFEHEVEMARMARDSEVGSLRPGGALDK